MSLDKSGCPGYEFCKQFKRAAVMMLTEDLLLIDLMISDIAIMLRNWYHIFFNKKTSLYFEKVIIKEITFLNC